MTGPPATLLALSFLLAEYANCKDSFTFRIYSILTWNQAINGAISTPSLTYLIGRYEVVTRNATIVMYSFIKLHFYKRITYLQKKKSFPLHLFPIAA